MSSRWDAPIEKLNQARSQSEAATATAMVVDLAVEGGVAAAPDADDLVDTILGIGRLEAHPWKLYLVWVLYEIARTLGVWTKASDNGHPRVREAVEAESRVSARLSGAAGMIQALCRDKDPQVRSIAFLVSALTADDPGTVARRLAEAESSEQDPLAQACAVQAVVVALARVTADGRDQKLVEWCRGRVISGTASQRGRMRRVIEGHSGATLAAAAREFLGEYVSQLVEPEGPFWPIEDL